MTPEEIMLIVGALDPSASVSFSDYTRKWYVASHLSIVTGHSFLVGLGQHADSPNAAVHAFFTQLTDLSLDEYVVSKFHGHRREWRWNGAAFAECTRDIVFVQEAAMAVERAS